MYVFPASHYVAGPERMNRAITDIEDELRVRLDELEGQNKLVEAQRLRMRTTYDLEMMQQMGFCNGIENYSRHIDGRDYVLEYPIKADLALVKALKADRWGNLVYRMTARNFGPIMASAASCTVVQVDEVVPLGALDPECIVTPGIHVHRVVRVATAPVEVSHSAVEREA